MTDLLTRLGAAPAKEITFFIPGEVRGKNDPRSRVVDGVSAAGKAYKFVHHYTDSKTRNYEAKIGSYAMQAKGQVGWAITSAPLAIEIVAYTLVPKSYSKKRRAELEGAPCPQKPDADNLCKCVGDGLRGVLLEDDKQLCSVTIKKLYARPFQPEGVFVRVTELASAATA